MIEVWEPLRQLVVLQWDVVMELLIEVQSAMVMKYQQVQLQLLSAKLMILQEISNVMIQIEVQLMDATLPVKYRIGLNASMTWMLQPLNPFVLQLVGMALLILQ